jgi:hypothetical protein
MMEDLDRLNDGVGRLGKSVKVFGGNEGFGKILVEVNGGVGG